MLDYMETHDVTDDYGNVLYNVTTVQSVKPKPAEAFAALREQFGAQFDAMPEPAPAYDTRTSTDRINALEAQVRRQASTIAALEAYIRDHSERDDVPFTTLRMAEDAWGVGG